MLAHLLNLGPAPSDAASADRAAQCRAASRPRLWGICRAREKKRAPLVSSKTGPRGHSLGGSGATPLRHAQRRDGRPSGLGKWKGQPKAIGGRPVKSPNANFPSSRSVVTEVNRQGAALPSDEGGGGQSRQAGCLEPLPGQAWLPMRSSKNPQKILRSRMPCRCRRAAAAAAWQRRCGAARRLEPPLHIVILAQCVGALVWMSCVDVL